MYLKNRILSIPFFIVLFFFSFWSLAQDSKQAQSNPETGTATTTPTDPQATQTPPAEEGAAEASPPKEEVKKDDSNELPFRYLNQYFAYEIQLPQNILLNDRSYNMSEFVVQASRKRLKITLGEGLSGNFKTSKLEFLNGDRKKLGERDIQLSGSKLEMETEITEGLRSVCLIAESKYSIARICKPIDSKLEKHEDIDDALKKVTADGVELGASGQVVLQDSKVRSNLSVEFKNGDWFYFETERRKVYPSTINKKADSLQINIRYVDLDDQTVAYDDVMVVGQRFFEIKLDPLISLRQDIVFSEEDIRNKAISRTLIDRAKVTIVTKNRTILTPIIAFQQLVGDNADLAFKLRSTMGFGLAAQYIKNFSSKWDWHVGGSFLTTKIVYDEADKVLVGKDQSIFELYGGTVYRLNRTLDLQGSLGFKNDMFATAINVDDGLEVSVGLNKYLEGVVLWNAFENRSFEIVAPLSIRFILPGKAGNVEAKAGTAFDLGVNGLFKTDWGRILTGMKYGSRIQKYDDFNFQEDYYYIMGGIVYLF